MDKVISELLAPFVRLLSPGSLTAAALFWGIGLFLFHLFHPQALPGCSTGGADLCGLLSQDGQRRAVAIALLLFAILVTAESVFARAAEFTQFLSGTRWSKRWLFIFLQHRTRERLIKRGYGARDLSADPGTCIRPPNVRCRVRADRYPQGVPRNPHGGTFRPLDVPLEPTFLGNVFAATHQHILVTHGLRLHSCWRLLLVVLPESERMKLVTSSSTVLARTQGVMWSGLVCIWALWLPEHLWKIGWIAFWLTVAYLAYRGLCKAAGEYCDDLKPIILKNRWLLYDAVNFALPKSTFDELKTGLKLSGYLDRKGPPEDVEFQWPTGGTDTVRKLL